MSDLRQQLKSISPDHSELLERWLRRKRLPNLANDEKLRQEYDVVVLGGGLAGLTVALQLKRARPETSILVIEKRTPPLPEAAFKVGESTAEVGATYLGKMVGLQAHLEADQLPKLGLRVFFTDSDNADIAARVEVGPTRLLPVPTFQVDRGRLENLLRYEVRQSGIMLLEGRHSKDVTFGRDAHAVTVRGADELTVKARWIVDASGRASLLKRRLDLGRSVGHDANAVWFRIGAELDVGEWSDDKDWQRTILTGLRRLSTNHLMGCGYWVWLIPLASGSTSVGIVADQKLHPFADLNRFERALSWLWKHEPQCAQAVEEKRHLLQDFRGQRHFAYGCTRLFSTDRWCLTGEAGAFLDPLYSPGTDLIGLANGCITDLVVRELNGEPIAERVDVYNWFLLDFWFESGLRNYEHQYPLMGNPQVMTAKIAWDSAFYWGTVAFLFLHGKIVDLEFMGTIREDLLHVRELNARVQTCFREWGSRYGQEYRRAYVDYSRVDLLYDIHCRMASGLPEQDRRANTCRESRIGGVNPKEGDATREQFAANVIALEALAIEFLAKARAGPPATSSVVEGIWLQPRTKTRPVATQRQS